MPKSRPGGLRLLTAAPLFSNVMRMSLSQNIRHPFEPGQNTEHIAFMYCKSGFRLFDSYVYLKSGRLPPILSSCGKQKSKRRCFCKLSSSIYRQINFLYLPPR